MDEISCLDAWDAYDKNQSHFQYRCYRLRETIDWYKHETGQHLENIESKFGKLVNGGN
jgi:hypothetical protein